MKKLFLWIILAGFLVPSTVYTQSLLNVSGVEPQPLLAQAIRLDEALSFLGSALSAEDAARLRALQDNALSEETTRRIQQILDPYCLAMVNINPEGRVMVVRGPGTAELVQGGWKSFLIKVHNNAGVTARLQVESTNGRPLLHISTNSPRVKTENILTPGQVANRFLELSMYRNRPLQPNLSGLKLEYAIVQIYSKDVGQREANIGFHIGQGSQDIGFRNAIDILFNCRPSVSVIFNVKDDDGAPVMASFVITDGLERITNGEELPSDYRLSLARREYDTLGSPDFQENEKYKFSIPAPVKRLTGIYPLPSRRVATSDTYPDFFFHPQVYRTDGEHVLLPPGTYDITFTRGPEYIPQTKQIVVPPEVETFEVSFQLKRWIHMASLGWYSADHHVHAAGCSHYESPEEGVRPEHMWRQVLGEDLNVASVLTWGPCWYHQKTFFTGKVHPLSTGQNILRYDVEVSGFPSSHAGHVCLLRLQEDDYPGTSTIEEWPSWTLPVLQWAKGQGGVVGYAHSGWGLEPVTPTEDLPNYVMPKMDGIGANEYIVTVTQDAVDFYSAGDTPAPWELNMWYHTLNTGFRTRLSGETDFPCIFDERVGLTRSYAWQERNLEYDSYVEAVRAGRSYVSEGRSHIIDFFINNQELGTNGSEVSLESVQPVRITARAAAYLPLEQNETGARIASKKMYEQPYWHLERARIEATRKVPVELIVNGISVETRAIVADGGWNELSFTHPIQQSSWVAVRIYPSAHTNPIFVLVDGKPIRASKRSAEWCRRAVDQCWTMKYPLIREEERATAEATYNKAREVYDRIIRETSNN